MLELRRALKNRSSGVHFNQGKIHCLGDVGERQFTPEHRLEEFEATFARGHFPAG
jgi:hypothetical protein